MRRLLALLSFVLAPQWASASDLPRVASVNVCTDQLVMMLAAPDQVVSLSKLARDRRSSAMADQAGQYAMNNGTAEMIAVQTPDVVVAGQYNDPAMIALLRSIEVEVVQFPITSSLDQIPDQIRLMGDVLGQDAKADAIARALEHDLANRSDVAEDAPLAAFFLPNGYALGAGTLSHDILVAGGARNLSVELGFQGNGTLSLEQVILHQPDILIGSQTYPGFSLSEDMVRHPSLGEFPMMHTSVDWVCGTPLVVNAIDEVAAQVEKLRDRTGN